MKSSEKKGGRMNDQIPDLSMFEFADELRDLKLLYNGGEDRWYTYFDLRGMGEDEVKALREADTRVCWIPWGNKAHTIGETSAPTRYSVYYTVNAVWKWAKEKLAA